jgi:hypothetical protein
MRRPQGPPARFGPDDSRIAQLYLEMDYIDEFFQLFFHLFQSGVSSRYGEGYAIYIVVGDGARGKAFQAITPAVEETGYAGENTFVIFH